MEISVVASFPGRQESLSTLGDSFRVAPWQDRSGISIELMDGSSSGLIDQAIVQFVSALRTAITGVPANGELRVAVYFSPQEVAGLVISLPEAVLRLLTDTGLSLEVACFPCSS